MSGQRAMGEERPIRMAEITAHHAPHEEALCETFRRVLRSGRFILGPEVEALEREVAALHGARFGVGVTSGTDALLAVLMALGVGPGDEVVTTPLSFFATAAVIVRAGARPVFADVGEDWLLDPRAAERAVTPRTRAVIPVHLFGQVAEIPDVRVPVIEDAAQAIGAARVGKLGRAACFSFFPTKNLGAIGDAGMVLTDDEDLARRLRVLRSQGQPRKNVMEVVGGNFRIDELQAALLRVELPHLSTWNERRRANARRYGELLAGTRLCLPRLRDGDVVHHYVVRAPERDRLKAHLRERGIETEIYYPTMHTQPALAHLRASCPRAEAMAAEALALPVHAEMTDADVARVAGEVRAFYG